MHQRVDGRAGRSTVAGRVGSTGDTAHRSARLPPSALARLHRQLGNRGVAQLVQRRGQRHGAGLDTTERRATATPTATATPASTRPVQLAAVPLAAVRARDTGTGFRTVTQPVGIKGQTGFAGLQNLSTDPDLLILGHVSEPMNVKAPQYRLTWTQTSAGWSCTPEWINMAYEGDNDGVYVKAGDYQKTFGPTPDFIHVSRAIARISKRAEQEHIDDIDRAADISIFDAEQTLYQHVIGKTFVGAAKADAERLVRKAIDDNLAEPRLGSDQTTWLDTYRMLYRKTLLRDERDWHSWGGDATMYEGHPDYPDGYIQIDVAVGEKMNVGEVSSADLITY